jgi:MOSC domain-containing protein YiiM
MSPSVAALVAHLQVPGHDAGDCFFFVDLDLFLVGLDLSEAGLPVGAQLRLGGVLCVVSPEPHTGCEKFRARFGAGALRRVNHEDNVQLRLRGLDLTVLEGGRVQVGGGVDVQK